MEGVTEPCFRELVLERNPPGQLGGAFTEFVPVVDHVLKINRLREALGERRFAAPVGIQLIGSNDERMAGTAANAVEAGAPVVDINFGCPTKGALRSCAGSALLKNPADLERIVRSVVTAVAGAVPVTAKMRAGYDNDLLLESLARAAEAGGASMLTIHCRTRSEGYCEKVDWTRIARAVAAVTIPVCGNGGVARHGDLLRMQNETGCAYVMIGRAALGDPWIFSNRTVGAGEAAEFLLNYAKTLVEKGDFTKIGAAARVKQLLHFWTAGNLLNGERERWLREGPAGLLERIAAAGNIRYSLNANDAERATTLIFSK